MKKITFVSILTILNLLAFSKLNAQTDVYKVIGSIDIGTVQITTFVNEASNCVKKSSAHTKDLFSPNEIVNIISNPLSVVAEVQKVGLNEKVYTSKDCIQNESNLSYEAGLKMYDILSHFTYFKGDFSSQIAITSELQNYALLNSKAIESQEVLDATFNYETSDSHVDLDSLVNNGEVSNQFRSFLISFNTLARNLESKQDLIELCSASKLELAILSNSLDENEAQFLSSFIGTVEQTAKFMIDNNITHLPLAAGPGIKCGGAIVGYGAGFVGLCMATNPIGWAVGIIGFASGVWGVFDNCK